MQLLVEQPQLHGVCLNLTWYKLLWEKGGLYSHAHKQFSIVFITGRTDSCHKRHVHSYCSSFHIPSNIARLAEQYHRPVITSTTTTTKVLKVLRTLICWLDNEAYSTVKLTFRQSHSGLLTGQKHFFLHHVQ